MKVRAVNTAADSENKIHDDAVASRYGFRGGLVPGVTVYGYLAAAAIEHYGPEWLERGAMDVRFHEPVYEGDNVEIITHCEGDRLRIEGGKCAAGIAWLGKHPQPEPISDAPIARKLPSVESLAPGTVFGTYREALDLTQSKMSAPLEPSLGGKAHPAILMALANRIFVENYDLGPWIHVGSEVRNFRCAWDGEQVVVRAKIVDRYERKGHEFVVYDAIIAADSPIGHVRHTAIWRPRAPQ